MAACVRFSASGFAARVGSSARWPVAADALTCGPLLSPRNLYSSCSVQGCFSPAHSLAIANCAPRLRALPSRPDVCQALRVIRSADEGCANLRGPSSSQLRSVGHSRISATCATSAVSRSVTTSRASASVWTTVSARLGFWPQYQLLQRRASPRVQSAFAEFSQSYTDISRNRLLLRLHSIFEDIVGYPDNDPRYATDLPITCLCERSLLSFFPCLE